MEPIISTTIKLIEKILMQGCSPREKGLQEDWHLLHCLCGC